jgi:hypothetical protein
MLGGEDDVEADPKMEDNKKAGDEPQSDAKESASDDKKESTDKP